MIRNRHCKLFNDVHLRFLFWDLYAKVFLFNQFQCHYFYGFVHRVYIEIFSSIAYGLFQKKISNFEKKEIYSWRLFTLKISNCVNFLLKAGGIWESIQKEWNFVCVCECDLINLIRNHFQVTKVLTTIKPSTNRKPI